MSKNEELAKQIIELVGGKENVSQVLHCMTRLRFRLKDESAPKTDEIKKLPGVLGVQPNIGEYQIIIGPKVIALYNEVVKAGGFQEMSAVDENLDSNDKKAGKGNRKIGDKIFEVVTGCITPNIPAFVVMGLLNSIIALFGPSLLNVISETSDVYVLIKFMADAVTYFLPFLLAHSASKKLGTNTTISIVLAGILMSPTLIGIVDAGQSFTVFGIPMVPINYASSFLPMLLIVFVQFYVEKLLNKIIPDIVKTLFVPTLTVLVMAVLGLCLLGPVGQWLGNGLASIIMALSEHAGWLEGALVAALYPFLVAFGMGGPVFLATFAVFTSTGLDYLYFPFAEAYGMCIVGVVLAYIIKTKSANDKQVGMVALTSQLLGKVTEPTIYGILFKNRTCLIVEVVASAIAGFYLGLMHVAMVNLTISVPFIGSFIMYAGDSKANMINGCIGMVLALVLGFVGTMIFYKEETAD